MDKKLHVYYSGSVQGVGFRYGALRLADSLQLGGWVRNLRDGRVEVVCEGSEKALKEFLNKISDIFGSYVHDSVVEWANAAGEFNGFDIRYD